MTKAEARRENRRRILNAQRLEAGTAMQNRIRHARADRQSRTGDPLEQADTGNQNDIEFALVQMRAETLCRVNEALARLDAGQYGSCIECEAEIAASRLRALPFAVRCRDCAERHEQRTLKARPSAAPELDRLSPFALVVGP